MAGVDNGWVREPAPAELRVLFVDDDPLMRRAVRRHLAAHGVELIAVAFEGHVEPLLASGPYDAVLCDYHLGDGTSTPLVRRLVGVHGKVAVLTSDPDGALQDAGLDGVRVLSKSDFGQVLAWLREPSERPGNASHERQRVDCRPAEPSRPSVAKLAIEAPAVPRSATPVELAAYEDLELPDPRDAQGAAQGRAADAPTRQMRSAPRLRAITSSSTSPAPLRPSRAPLALAFVLGAGVGGGTVSAALWLAGALG